MPRKTKAQLNAEYEQIRLEQIEEERAEYFSLLMKTLEDATTAGFSMCVREGKFAVWDNDRFSCKDEYLLTPEYTEDNYIVLQDLKFEVGHQLFLLEEARRKADLRNNALAKLTQEERELLNL